MSLRALLRSCRQLWDRSSSDVPIQPHCLMPTVPEALQAVLNRQPVMLLGERWVVPDIEDQPDYPPVDFERLPP